MADIASGDVTYTIKNLRRLANSRVHNRVELAFGDGALTVGSGGVPLLKGKLGCPNAIESLTVVAQGTSGYVFSWNPATDKLTVRFADYDATADGALIATTAAIAAQTIQVEVIGW